MSFISIPKPAAVESEIAELDQQIEAIKERKKALKRQLKLALEAHGAEPDQAEETEEPAE